MIIVSLTSWKKRITNTPKVIFSLMNQTVKPDKIILNLSYDEFANKENDLPEELLLLQNEIFEINWVKENTNVFKKIIPTIQKFYGKDYILFSCDDDWIYGKQYIEKMIKALGNKNSFCASKHKLIGNRICYKSKIFDSRLWECLSDKIISLRNDDAYLDVYFKFKHIQLSNADNKSIIEEIKEFNQVFPNGKIDGGYTTEKVKMTYKLIENELRKWF
jgi:hypothetical protein